VQNSDVSVRLISPHQSHAMTTESIDVSVVMWVTEREILNSFEISMSSLLTYFPGNLSKGEKKVEIL
jgi:hypothetical protein